MIIKSSFKDYYDFVAGKYGGGDPKVVYVRGVVATGQRMDYKEFNRIMDIHRGMAVFDRQFFYENSSNDNRVRGVVIDRALLIFCGKCYPLIDTRENPLKGPTWVIDVEMIERWTPKFLGTHKWERNYYGNRKLPEFGIEEEPWIGLCKAERSPVFVLVQDSGREIQIEHLVPKLNKLGFASIISAEQAYQQIAYYVGNVCRESVDVKPPVEVGNKDRIVGHGFDLITSFRGRRV